MCDEVSWRLIFIECLRFALINLIVESISNHLVWGSVMAFLLIFLDAELRMPFQEFSNGGLTLPTRGLKCA